MAQSRFSALPKIDDLINQATELVSLFGRSAVTSVIRSEVGLLRENLQSDPNASVPEASEILRRVRDQLERTVKPSLRPVINLTGTVLHTNLGRARLPERAIAAMQAIGGQYSNLEYDLEQGERGDRDTHIDALLREITGAEAATVVNNNAAAVLITLSALANNKEVPVSRGELVEIGGSFRIPDIMSQSGCTLREIGTTNRTHKKDYENAINGNTALLMKVHTSNYEIQGFTHEVTDQEVAQLAHDHDLPFVTDLGSGTMIDLRQWGLPYETTVQDSLAAGADVVTFSGDKLLGGPQCGLIVGRKDLIDKIKRHPLKRALRLDKMTLIALSEVLRLYLHPEQLSVNIPALRDLTRSKEGLKRTADLLIEKLTLPGVKITCVELESQIGSGALPTHTIPSAGIALTPEDGSGSKLMALEQAFRDLPTPILGRISDGALLFDLRTLDRPEDILSQIDQLPI